MSKIFTKPRSESDILSDELEEMLTDFRGRHSLSDDNLNFIDEIIMENKKRKSRPVIVRDIFCNICGRRRGFNNSFIINISGLNHCYLCFKKARGIKGE